MMMTPMIVLWQSVTVCSGAQQQRGKKKRTMEPAGPAPVPKFACVAPGHQGQSCTSRLASTAETEDDQVESLFSCCSKLQLADFHTFAHFGRHNYVSRFQS